MARVVVSIVTYNGGDFIEPCLRSIFAQTFTDLDIVVLDNASKDSTREIVARLTPEVRLLAQATNLGFAGGHNEVIRSTRSEYVLIVNQDLVLDPQYIERSVAFLDASESASSVTGKIWKVSDLTQTSASDRVDTCGIGIKRNHYAGPYGSKAFPARISETHEVFGASGTIALYRRAALEDVAFSYREKSEYFDEDFFMYKEDVDLAYRLRWRGWRAYSVAGAHGWHIGSTQHELLQRQNPRINYWSYRNHWYLLIKNVSCGVLTRCIARIAWYEWGKLVYNIWCDRHALASLGEVVRNLQRMHAKRHTILSRRTISDRQMIAFLDSQ
jgi:GT2 family glycosyltransferase